MKQAGPSVTERAPFLFMGVLCWLCGAVVVGLAIRLVAGWASAAVAVTILTLFVLAVFWSLSSSAGSTKK
jgi:uncharacterized membrane protein YhaH (DUF805 family)